MGEENNRKPTKRLIEVRKFRNNPEDNLEEEFASAVALAGTSTTSRDPDCTSFSGCEEVIQVIEPGTHSDSSSRHPIEFMFPHLRQEGVDTNNLTKTMSTSDLTKLLIGKKANMTDSSRRCYKRRQAVDFTTIKEEDDENSSSEDSEKPRKKITIPTIPTEKTDDDDGNESDISDNEEEEEDK